MSDEQKGTVYDAIKAVSQELATEGIGKTRTNPQGTGYKFRGIDEVLNALGAKLPKHGLVIVPRMVARECVERQSKSGGALFAVTVEAEFDFVSVADGSKHTARTFGEAMDSGDKATNKAMSAAYKYAAFLTFCIPLEGMAEDADGTTHEVKGADDDAYVAFVLNLEAEAVKGRTALWDAIKASSFKRRLEQDAVTYDALKATAVAAEAKAAALKAAKKEQAA